ncbi:MAG TPA: toprim domain-containing protein, partial [Vicinamibacterales bacterium]
PIRGKILNVEKARFDKMLSSEEIRTIIAALGCGIGTDDFDLSKLRYHRVIIMTDADVDGSHIRTLLLTFFYRQMPQLIEAGHVYIAQPPLYRAKRGKGETYIKDDRELEQFLIRRAAEARQLRIGGTGEVLQGEDLVAMLQRLIAYQKQMQLVERRGQLREVVEALLRQDVRDKAFFADRAGLEAFASAIATPDRTVSIETDEEHNLFELLVEDRSNGYPRRHVLSADFLTGSDYRALALAYREVKDFLQGPFEVSATGTPAEESEEEAPAAPAEAATDVRPRPRGREERVTLPDIDALVRYFIDAGNRGIAINRYKGLGEMNPETLWHTTMNPEDRTLLQVRAEDHAEADLMFTTLMGDQVEPRRRFIEDNALDVKNLDI